jgi:hypothetical protein
MTEFYNKKEIFNKVFKIYSSGKLFTDFIEDGALFVLEIKLPILKQSDLKGNYSIVLNECSSLKKENFELLYKEFNFKNMGLQKLPIAINFRNRESFLNYISKFDEFEQFKKNYKKIVFKFPLLKEAILKKPFLVLDYAGIWDELFLVCDFFIKNPKPNIYTRELSIAGVDTKFIEKNKKILDIIFSILLKSCDKKDEISSFSNYGFEKKYFLKYPMPVVRFRILDETQKLSELSDISVTIAEFKKLTLACENVFIVENKITTLSFPSLNNSIVIFGSGYGIESLKDVEWLNNKKLFYWGDIDTDGFAILSQARGFFKNINSIFMDEITIERFAKYSVKESKAKIFKKKLLNLKDEESIIYNRLINDYYSKGFRLEQERIPFDYIKERLANDNTI